MIRYRRLRLSYVPIAMALVAALSPGIASACVIDNTASLYADGVRATPSTSAPSNGFWAPFTVDKAFASRAILHLTEARSDLERSLTASELSAPYRWLFGDNTTSLGHAVSHRYRRPGSYRITIYAFSQRTHRWFPFDNVAVRIVPPDQMFQANLGYYTLRAVDIVVSGLFWIIDALAALLLGYIVFLAIRSRGAKSRVRPRPGNALGTEPPAGPL